jgi:hypothetical protein
MIEKLGRTYQRSKKRDFKNIPAKSCFLILGNLFFLILMQCNLRGLPYHLKDAELHEQTYTNE